MEVEAHAAAAAEAADLAAIQALEAAHGDRAEAHMSELGHSLADMDDCDGIPDDRMGAMRDVHDACATELERHRDTVAAATDLAAARVDEDPHRAAMMGDLDDLDGMMHDMMDDHGMMMCGGHHGMDDHEPVRCSAPAHDRRRRDRKQLERVRRYMLRPPLAHDAVQGLPDGRVRILFKAPWRSGVAHADMTPDRFLAHKLRPLAVRGRP